MYRKRPAEHGRQRLRLLAPVLPLLLVVLPGGQASHTVEPLRFCQLSAGQGAHTRCSPPRS